MKPWIQKYIPKNTKEVFGQDKAVEQLLYFVNNYKAGKNKSCILYGGVGSGKTSAVHAIANELKLEIIEMNASDFRNKDMIDSFLGTAIGQRSLFFRSKLILIDEIDGLSGTKDRGGIQAITKIIEKSTFPVICTVNDPYDIKLKGLRKSSQLVEFSTLDYRTIANNLKRILDIEGCKYDEEAVNSIARRAGGDMRAAINDAQTLVSLKEDILTMDTVKEMEENDRDKTESILNSLLIVLKTVDIDIAKNAFENVDEDVDKIGLWLEENIPKEYEGKDLKRALMWMSKADVYKGRIRRWQHWRFLVYIYAFYSAGIALSKDEKYKKFVKYGPTTKILKIWQANMKYQKRKAIAEKIAAKTHSGTNRVIKEVLPYVRIMCKNRDCAENIQKEFELEKEEIEWLKSTA
jgi:replication factor C large subunit